MNQDEWQPTARTEGLLVTELADETVIYDALRDRAHCLNGSARTAWRLCDGSRSIVDISAALACETGLPASVEVAELAVGRLGAAHLLKGGATGKAPPVLCSRRALARRLGLAAGMTALLPLVTTIVAPTPADAASCVSVTTCRGGCPGSGGKPCCSSSFKCICVKGIGNCGGV